MSLSEDKTRILKILKERKRVVLNRLRIIRILNKNAKTDVDEALSSLATDGKVKKEDSQNILFSVTTTTSTTTTTTTI